MNPCSGRRMQPKEKGDGSLLCRAPGSGSAAAILGRRALQRKRYRGGQECPPRETPSPSSPSWSCRKPKKKRAADASRTQAAPTLGWDASLSATPGERFTENGGEADPSRRAVRLPLLCQLRAPERGDSAAGILARRAVAKNGHRASAYLSRSGVDKVALPDRRPTLPDRPKNL